MVRRMRRHLPAGYSTPTQTLPLKAERGGGCGGRTLRCSEDRPHGARVETDQRQRQGDQLVDPFRDVFQDEPLQDRHVVGEEPLVGGQVLGLEEVHARRVDAHERDAALVKMIDQLRSEGGAYGPQARLTCGALRHR